MKEKQKWKARKRAVQKGFSKKILQTVKQLEQEGRYTLTKQYPHHGKITIYQHSFHVALVSCCFAKKYRLPVRYDCMIRGALLHDYYLYDWHKKEKGHRLHGFRHPKTAFRNAQQEYGVSEIEKNIILCHMFPLTLLPPLTMESWIVCIADKICSIQEYWQTSGK